MRPIEVLLADALANRTANGAAATSVASRSDSG
jgi:hypothetical protein